MNSFKLTEVTAFESKDNKFYDIEVDSNSHGVFEMTAGSKKLIARYTLHHQGEEITVFDSLDIPIKP